MTTRDLGGLKRAAEVSTALGTADAGGPDEPERCCVLLTAIEYGIAALLAEGFNGPELRYVLGSMIADRDVSVRGLRRGYGRRAEWRLDHGKFIP